MILQVIPVFLEGVFVVESKDASSRYPVVVRIVLRFTVPEGKTVPDSSLVVLFLDPRVF